MRWFSRLCWWRPPCLLRTVIVNLRSGEAIQGVLWQSRGPWLGIRSATLLRAGSAPTPFDGEALVHRDNLAFVQVLP